MYHDYFGLHDNPFRQAPGAEFFFASRSHREALAALQWGLSDPTGLVLLSGDVGTGKTTVIRELFSRETGGIRIALIDHPRLPFDELLRSILQQLKLAVPEGRARMLEALGHAAERQRVVVVIDEAQQLSDEGLEEFRLLSNSNPERLQLMLAGQPELLERLSSPELRQLNQRIAVRAVLAPFGSAETADYLQHRIRAAGGDARRIFTRRALRAIARTSHGIPRRINILSHNAMLFAYSAGSKRVRPNHAVAAALECDQSSVPLAAPPSQPVGQIWRRALLPAMLLAAGVVSGVLYRGASPSEPARYRAPSKRLARTMPLDRLFDPPVLAAASKPVAEDFASGLSAPTLTKIAATSSAPGPAVKTPAPFGAQAMAPEVPGPIGADAEEDLAAKHRDTSLPNSLNAGGAREVVVQLGDTLSGIAERFGDSAEGLDVAQLVAANPEIKDANLIYPGERIRLTTSEGRRESAQ
ncbi:MAG: AAA family ATPase [Candidatus Binatus sp.]|uniref:AAA family ATPase n=1 Tax=Candidatus Binatus sp. TaxID=2811406 RepID=UPI00271F23E3|nr:AAA family ATPase [Candidatus Binatus sp.]MDO8432694.1 AAA family ATPase [Candidatus Binatus sp.]